MSPGGGEEGCWGSSRCAPTPLAFSVCPSVCAASADLCPLSAQARSSLCLTEPQLKPPTPAEGRAAASSASSCCTKRWLKGEGSVRLLLCLLHAGTGLCRSCSPGQALPRARTEGVMWGNGSGLRTGRGERRTLYLHTKYKAQLVQYVSQSLTHTHSNGAERPVVTPRAPAAPSPLHAQQGPAQAATWRPPAPHSWARTGGAAKSCEQPAALGGGLSSQPPAFSNQPLVRTEHRADPGLLGFPGQLLSKPHLSLHCVQDCATRDAPAKPTAAFAHPQHGATAPGSYLLLEPLRAWKGISRTPGPTVLQSCLRGMWAMARREMWPPWL